MTPCDADRLSRFLDGDLESDEYRETADHLRQCSECRQELAALRQADGAVWAWGARREPVPPATEARLHRSIQRRKRLRVIFAVSRMMPAALGTSVAAVLVLLSANLSPLYQASRQPTPGNVGVISSQSLKQQSTPLLYARAKSAVVSTNPVVRGQSAFARHPQLDDIY